MQTLARYGRAASTAATKTSKPINNSTTDCRCRGTNLEKKCHPRSMEFNDMIFQSVIWSKPWRR
jgi:hypothetical protein